MTRFVLTDPAACIGCRTCEAACALEHATAAHPFSSRLQVLRLDHLSVSLMCHQCENAPCVSACPVGALTMGASRVEADSSRCIACQGCVVACPFGAISIALSAQRTPLIVKCDLCEHREQGPACVDVCPTSAITLMTRESVAELQQKRMKASARLLSP
ncbi:MAG: 4Fe-4S dicluster domain-containing protein [Leclercia sp.]